MVSCPGTSFLPMVSLAARFFAGFARRGTMRGLKHLGLTIEERLKYLHEYGNEWDEKPVCQFLFFSWIKVSHSSHFRTTLYHG